MHQDFNITALLACVHLDWSPQIGDPTIAGWLTVVAYAICAVLGFMVFIRQENRREKAFWLFVALTMAFLCANKQLDLQSLLTALGRCTAKLQGWYEERRAFQRSFVLGLLIIAVVFAIFLIWLMRGHLKRNGLALLGLVIVTAFVTVRAVGFHHFDVLIDQRFADVRYNAIFELSGLILIAINAVAQLRQYRR